jgi:magnesium transporter
MLRIRHAKADDLEEIDRETAIDLLRRGDSNLWFHFDTPSEDELQFLQNNLKIHDLTMEDVVHQNQRPKLDSFDDYVYLAIHPLQRTQNSQIDRSELDLLLGRNWIVSVHYGPLPGLIEDSHLQERIVLALGRGPDFMLYIMLDLIVDSYFPLLDEIEEEIDTLEDRLLIRGSAIDVKRLLALKRNLVRIRRAILPQREIFNQLTRHDFAFIRPQHLVYFRDVYDHLIRIVEELDTLRETLSSVLEIYLASTSNQLNATMKRFTAWGTIFIVITAIAGIYGMNFKFMPELEWHYGYFVVLGLMTVMSLGLYFYFKKKGHL